MNLVVRFNKMQISSAESTAQAKKNGPGFPDPSVTLVEFSEEGLGILLASRTERDPANRRLALKKVAYVRLEQKCWGALAFPEVWVWQNAEGLFLANEAQGGKIFRYPSTRRYEVAFLSQNLFECSIQCVKERKVDPLYELIAVTFANRAGFSVESGFLVAPDDYAAETNPPHAAEWVPVPPRMESKAARA